MLTWLRTRRQVDDIHRTAVRPIHILHSRQPALFPAIWQIPYCCTLTYFWTAYVAEDLSPKDETDSAKFRTLREAFARLAEETGGMAHESVRRVLPDGDPIRRRALVDLKRVVELYKGKIDDRYMLYPEYRDAVYEDGRPAKIGNRWGLKNEFAYQILLSAYLEMNITIQTSESS